MIVGISQNAHQIRTQVIINNIVEIIKAKAEFEMLTKVCAEEAKVKWSRGGRGQKDGYWDVKNALCTENI